MDRKEGSIKNSTILSCILMLPLMLFNINVETLRGVKTIVQTENNPSGILNKTKIPFDPKGSSELVSFYPPSYGSTYYVGPDGDDSRSKSKAQNYNTPWLTIQKAANEVEPGDKVIVKDGIYRVLPEEKTYTVDLRRGGTKNNWVIFKAENKWGAKIYGENNRVHSGWNFEENANYVLVERFEIYGFAFYGFWDNHDCHDIYIYNNHEI